MERLYEILLGGFKLCLKMFLIIIPLMVCYEFINRSNWFKRAEELLKQPLRLIHLTPKSIIPMVSGIFLGIAYGGGILIEEAKNKKINPDELFLVSLFLSTCHAVLEDTLIFVVVGGKFWWILGPRIILAFSLVILTGFYFRLRGGNNEG